ncbi:MAG: translation initiation factor IF-5A [Nanoarchaeota archaeon]|nr:translation initiation factor IF-5A [Nanoarchaeota archaeon]MCG2718515.1 translation initiation factor IF-5A [Nanoarchaeota archaeon]
MNTKQTTAGTLKQGTSVVFDGIACTVKKVDKSKTGKHGSAKCRIEAIGMINGEKIIKVMPASNNVDVPIIEKKTAQVLSINGNTANVMDTETYETFDIEIPDELTGQVIDGCQVLYWIILDKKIVKQVK